MKNILKIKALRSYLVLVILVVNTSAFSQFTVSKLYNNHMVIQQNEIINVWGTANLNTSVSVQFNNKTYKTKANYKGDWLVSLPKMKPGGPFKMILKSGKEIILIDDILIGDVWICSGQSNMEWPLSQTENASLEIAQVSDTNIRHFKVPISYAEKPENTLAGGIWEVASPTTVGNFTAVGYYFAKNLRATNNQVPIGLINTSWGGSRIEPWMNAKTLNIDNPEVYLKEAQREQNAGFETMLSNLKKQFPYLTKEDAGTVNNEPIWAVTNLDESDWIAINVPDLWENQGFEGFDGIAWYRTSFELTAEQAKNSITLSLGMVDDSDYVWINGQKVGETVQQYSAKRIYTIDSNFLVEGQNTLTVKVHDLSGGGGIYGANNELFIKTVNNQISLAKKWKFKVGSYTRSMVGVNQVAMMLYNKMIYPLVNYPIKGVIWYQGESNANSTEEAVKYSELFQAMITQWRQEWNIGDFPFLWVQLANFMQPQEPSVESNWALLRASQSSALKLPNTAEAVIIDIGNADDIHPKNKKDVGYRLSLGARKIIYKEPIVYSGPTYKSQEILEDKIILSFNTVGSGLKTTDKYNYVKGFTIAGADKKFVWAQATIKNNQVIVWNTEVKKPLYVRYAWADNPDDANLYNKEGLPASPFKTD
ncbi:sialate O-acetylesterase [Lutibacter sp.]|uniref:sialate O-acetylesterase n=1 Tax=Lutibacter sp. TaxID=1925666 RepID=UPI00356AEE2A